MARFGDDGRVGVKAGDDLLRAERGVLLVSNARDDKIAGEPDRLWIMA
jgi:hypothetical protein